MSKTKESLQKILSNLLASRLVALEKNENAMNLELMYCERLIKDVAKSFKSNLYLLEINSKTLDTELIKTPRTNKTQPRNIINQTKSINRASRSKTPQSSAQQERSNSNIRLKSERSLILNPRKNKENSSIMTKKVNNNNLNRNKFFMSSNI